MSQDEGVDITIRFNGTDTYHIVQKNEPFAPLFLQVKERFKIDSDLRFFFEHKEVKPAFTPLDIGIGNYDIITAKVDKSILVNLEGLANSTEPVSIRMPKTAKFSKIFLKVCSKLGLSQNELVFTYNKNPIIESHTPGDYQMRDGDVICVVPRQTSQIPSPKRISLKVILIDGTIRSRTVDPSKPMKILCEREIRNSGVDRNFVKFFVGDDLIDPEETFEEAGIGDGSTISMQIRLPHIRSNHIRAVPRVYSQHPDMVSFVVRYEDTKDFKISMKKDEIMGIMMKRVCETLGVDSSAVKFMVVDENGYEERPLSYQKPCDLGLEDGAYVKVSKFV